MNHTARSQCVRLQRQAAVVLLAAIFHKLVCWANRELGKHTTGACETRLARSQVGGACGARTALGGEEVERPDGGEDTQQVRAQHRVVHTQNDARAVAVQAVIHLKDSVRGVCHTVRTAHGSGGWKDNQADMEPTDRVPVPPEEREDAPARRRGTPSAAPLLQRRPVPASRCG